MRLAFMAGSFHYLRCFTAGGGINVAGTGLILGWPRGQLHKNGIPLSVQASRRWQMDPLNSSSDGVFFGSASSVYSCVFGLCCAPVRAFCARPCSLGLACGLCVPPRRHRRLSVRFFFVCLRCCSLCLVGVACVGGMQDSLRPGVGRPRGRYAPRFVVLVCSADRPSRKMHVT